MPSELPSAPPPPSSELQEAQIKIIELQALLAEAKADRDDSLRRAAELEHQVRCKDAVIRKMEGEKKAEADSKRRGLKRAEDLYLTEKEAKERLVEEVEKLSKEVEKLREATELSDSEKETRDKEFAELKEKFGVADVLVTGRFDWSFLRSIQTNSIVFLRRPPRGPRREHALPSSPHR